MIKTKDLLDVFNVDFVHIHENDEYRYIGDVSNPREKFEFLGSESDILKPFTEDELNREVLCVYMIQYAKHSDNTPAFCFSITWKL